MQRQKDRVMALIVTIANDPNINEETREALDKIAEEFCLNDSKEILEALDILFDVVMEQTSFYNMEIKEARNYMKKEIKEEKKIAAKEETIQRKPLSRSDLMVINHLVKNFEKEWKKKKYTDIRDYFFDKNLSFQPQKDDEISKKAHSIASKFFKKFESQKLDIEDFILKYYG